MNEKRATALNIDVQFTHSLLANRKKPHHHFLDGPSGGNHPEITSASQCGAENGIKDAVLSERQLKSVKLEYYEPTAGQELLIGFGGWLDQSKSKKKKEEEETRRNERSVV